MPAVIALTNHKSSDDGSRRRQMARLGSNFGNIEIKEELQVLSLLAQFLDFLQNEHLFHITIDSGYGKGYSHCRR